MKTLRTIHEFCMVNLSYHFEQFAPLAKQPQLKSIIIMLFLDRFHSNFADVYHMG